MKKLTKHLHFCLFIFLLFPLSISAQVGVNGSNSDPDPSAMLDVQSIDKGMLVPRMTTAQRTAISSPATGLLVFDNETGSFWFYNGGKWTELGAGIPSTLSDADGDTKIEVEASPDEDIIRFKAYDIEAMEIGGEVYDLLQTASSNVTYVANVLNAAWQSFTAPTDAKIVSCEVYLGNNGGVNPKSFKLYDGQGTGGTELASFGPYTLNSGWNTLTLLTPVNITSGQKYTLWFSNYERINFDMGNPYPDGRASTFANHDFTIRVNYLMKSGSVNINTTLDVNGPVTATSFTGDGSGLTNLPTLAIVADTDYDTKIQVEESADDDAIRFDLAGTEHFRMYGPHLEVMNSGSSVFLGSGAGAIDDLTDNRNVFIGEGAGNNNLTGVNNSAVGYQALFYNNAGYNSAFGTSALLNNVIGSFNSALGNQALLNNYSGINNVAVGNNSLVSNITGSNNVALGNKAGFSNTGSGNIYLGNEAGMNATGSNTLYIDNSNTSSPLIYGEFDNNIVAINGKLGVGTSTPLNTLSLGSTIGASVTSVEGKKLAVYNNATGSDFYGLGVSGATLQIHAGSSETEAPDMVLTSGGFVGIGTTSPDRPLTIMGTGTASEWLSFKDTLGFTQWHINHKLEGLNFAETGAADGRLFLEAGGNVGVGTTNPSQKLDVNGTTTTNGFQIGSGTVMTGMQTGKVDVGASTTQNKVVAVTFPVAFSGVPQVICTASTEPGQSYNDIFLVQVRNLTATGFEMIVARIGGPSWGQDLDVNWFAVK